MSDERLQSTTPDFNQLEQEILKYWEENKVFEKSLEKTKDGEPYVFYDGPPFATGLPHYGSLLPSIIKDIIPRYQTMKGRYVRRRWGWDCHGLPIENIVEKNLGISGKKQIEELGVDKFNQACRENVLTFASEWGKIIRRIARWVDFDNSYKTMDTTYQESVWWALKQLWDKKLIYEDRKVLLYCARCETPISNFEVAMDNSYKDVTENSVFVKFKLLPRQRIIDFMTDDATFVLAWTTTPWTLPGNTALNVGPEIIYVVVEIRNQKPENSNQKAVDQRYILAKDRLEILDDEYEIIREVSARSLEGLQYEPLYEEIRSEGLEVRGNPEKARRIYIEDYVTTEDGTGVVHNAAMYGEEDYVAAKRRDLPRVDMLDNKGHYLDTAPEFVRGKFFKAADKLVLEDLQSRGLVYKILSFTHSYPHCHRCATPLYYLALPSWFINIQEIKQKLVDANEEVNWYPEHLKHGRFEIGLKNAPDWNISRNRYWATALPFWKCQSENCKKVICVGSIDDLRQRAINFDDVYPDFKSQFADFRLNSELDNQQSAINNPQSLDLHKPYIDRVILKCEKCSGEMKRIPEVVDCWVESGSMPFAELHYPFENGGGESHEDFKNRFPSDFVVEYIPQTRAWFYVMHVIGTVLFGHSPFKNVSTTGNILGMDGRKMSKSFGNYPDPNLVIDRYGADSLRFYLLSSPVTLGEDVNFSETGVKEVHQKVNMLLYNAWSFYRMYSVGKLETGNRKLEVRHVLDKWILDRLRQLIGNVTAQLDNYNTVKACREIVDFISDLSTWYVRRSRDRIKSGNEDGRLTLDVLGYTLAKISQVLAPFSPFISEFIYRDITGEESVHLTEWPAVEARENRQGSSPDERPLQQMDLVREIVSVGLSARKSAGIGVRQPLASFGFKLKEEASLSIEHIQLILDELNVKMQSDFDSLEEQGRRKGGVVSGSGRQVESVLLDATLSEELKEDGIVRELERAIQDLRKKSGLKVGEWAELYYNAPDEALARMLLEKVDRNKTFLREISRDAEVEVDNESQAIIGGYPVWLGLRRSLVEP